jgi:hypothetical protein
VVEIDSDRSRCRGLGHGRGRGRGLGHGCGGRGLGRGRGLCRGRGQGWGGRGRGRGHGRGRGRGRGRSRFDKRVSYGIVCFVWITTNYRGYKMKKIVSVTEVDGEGLVKFLGQRVTLFCTNYFYTGVLSGVNDNCVLLENAGVVFETGSFSDKEWKDYQPLPNDLYVMIQAIESFTILK